MSCVTYVHSKIPTAPLVDAKWYQNFVLSTPTVGSVALFEYETVSHVAIVEEISEEGFKVSECNYKKGICSKRFVPWNHPSVAGFWRPSEPQNMYGG